jgi:hypothetical protein
MTHLSQALQKYYARVGKRILFTNHQSLNQLALAMWEELGCSQIDASVLSRVLKGERLFTVQQLRAFCKLLQLTTGEQEYLLACLQQDFDARLSHQTGITRLSAPLAQEIIGELSSDIFQMFYQGQYPMVSKRIELVRQLAHAASIYNTKDRLANIAWANNLYICGRIIGISKATGLVAQTMPIYRELIGLSRLCRSEVLYGYAHALLSDAYYGAGGYSENETRRKLYATSVKLAAKALNYLPEDDHESFFALRTMAASAYYLHDREAVDYVFGKAKQAIPRQPQSNRVNLLQLVMTLSKCLAAQQTARPFQVRDIAAKYFDGDLTGAGAYEISGIKEEVDTLRVLRSSEYQYMRNRIQQGIDMAGDYELPRYQTYFNRILRTM